MPSLKEDSIVLSEIDKIRFIQRLKQLQNLCSGTNPNYPQALLCVPGPDGRANKGSLMILKYLFQFAVGKDLFEGNLTDRFECMEEIIMLVQENSISLIVSVEAKAVLAPFLSLCPFACVYSSPGDAPEEVDEFQARKAATFKKLLLQNIAQGGVVGIPVPLGYDSVLDVENWSLMRSFAMESVVASTGFFTSRYTVIDVTEALDIIFRSVDSSVVSKVIDTIKNSIVPNVHQSLRILSGRGPVENRLKLTSEDILSPLDFLFEFGELDTVNPPDPLLKPMALFAQLSNALGSMPDHIKLAAPWRGATMPAGGVHVVLEGCEPSTGVRWCRTYFTQRGRQVCAVSDPDSLVRAAPVAGSEPTPAVAADVARLETLYTLLWEGLRAGVREVFGGKGGAMHPSNDVVSAGSDVEKYVDSFIKSRVPGGLRTGESLRIHMDCMDGLGGICRVEEIEDIGGQCLAFLRVSIHGIETSGCSQPVAVAVGDTFLYSPHSAQVRALLCATTPSDNSAILKHLQDSFCLTHPVPYMLGLFGIGAEDSSAQHLLHALGSTHLLALMGLGEPVEAHGSSSAYTFPLLTDHTTNPFFHQAELAFFEGGVVVERLNGATLPGVINFETHVEQMWTVDMHDALSEAQATAGGSDLSKDWIDLPEGLVVILKLKDLSGTRACDRVLNVNPFDAFLPECSTVQHVAFVVRSDTPSASGYFSRTAAKWKRSLRTNDIPDHRGLGGGSPSLPRGILSAFLALYDFWGVMGGSSTVSSQDVMAAANIPRNLFDGDSELAVEDVYAAASGPLVSAGAGYLPLKSLFIVCENARVFTAEAEMMRPQESEPAPPVKTPKSRSVSVGVVLALPGGAGLQVGSALLARLPVGSSHAVADFSDISIARPADVKSSSALSLNAIAAQVGERLKAATNGLATGGYLLLSLVLPPAATTDLPLLLDRCISCATQGIDLDLTVRLVISAVASHQFSGVPALPEGVSAEAFHTSNNRLGSEALSAAALSLCRVGLCDLILCTDSSPHGKGFTNLRRHVREIVGTSMPGGQAFDGELPLFRLRPPVIRIDDDVVDIALAKLIGDTAVIRSFSSRVLHVTNLGNISLFNPLSKVADVELSDEGESISEWLAPRFLEQLCPPEITGFTIQELRAVPEWRYPSKDRDFDMVIQCLRALFPKATVTASAANGDVWAAASADSAHPVGSIRRAMQLATTKVVVGKQLQVNRERIASHLARQVSPKVLQQVRGAVLSVYGHIQLPSGGSGASSDSSRKAALIDACSEFISVRLVDNFTWKPFCAGPPGGSRLVACGSMDEGEVDFLNQLFSQCYLQRLQRREHIFYSDLTPAELKEIQDQSSHIELPGGCWFDGHTYLDMSGTKSMLRPDIRSLSEGYLARRNAQVDIYNNLISHV